MRIVAAPPVRTSRRFAAVGRLVAVALVASCVAWPFGGLVAQTDDRDQASSPARGWRIGPWLKAGYQQSGSRLAKNSPSDVPDLGLLEVVSQLEPSWLWGGGLEVRFPARDLAVRVGWETSANGEISGRVAICELYQGELCRPEVAPVAARALVTQARVEGGRPSAPVRTVIFGGVEVRRLSVEPPSCALSAGDQRGLVCRAVVDTFLDPKTHFFLRGGLGLRFQVGNVRIEAAGSAGAGRYNGGANRTDGLWYHDMRAEISTSAMVF